MALHDHQNRASSWRRRSPLVAALLLAGAVQAMTLPASAAETRPLPTLSALLAVEDPASSSDAESTQPTATKAQRSKLPADDEAPIYTKWWFWAITGAVVAGTVGLVVWASESTETAAKPCAPGTVVCFGDGR